MLVLSRKLNEKIIIGRDISVTLINIEGSQVRLGFEAPPDVIILREELASTMQATAPGMQTAPRQRTGIDARMPRRQRV